MLLNEQKYAEFCSLTIIAGIVIQQWNVYFPSGTTEVPNISGAEDAGTRMACGPELFAGDASNEETELAGTCFFLSL